MAVGQSSCLDLVRSVVRSDCQLLYKAIRYASISCEDSQVFVRFNTTNWSDYTPHENIILTHALIVSSVPIDKSVKR